MKNREKIDGERDGRQFGVYSEPSLYLIPKSEQTDHALLTIMNNCY